MQLTQSLVITVLSTLVFLVQPAKAQWPPQPTAEHALLAADVGMWDAETKFWMAPGTEPMVTQAVETNRMLGKAWLISEFECEMAGQPFRGVGQAGYDAAKKKYVGTWIDSMSPYLTTMEGTYDEATKTVTYIAQGVNAMTGQKERSKMVSRTIDETHRHFEMLGEVPGQPGQWWKKMEISYTKRAAKETVK